MVPPAGAQSTPGQRPPNDSPESTEAPAPAGTAREIPLYPGVAPGSETWDWAERSVTNRAGLPMAQDVVHPVLLHYPAEKVKSTGTAMIVAPGGGFRTLMMSYEGVDIATRLNSMGVDALVLKYRLVYSGPGTPRRPGPRAAEKKARPADGPSASAERARRFSIIGAYKGQAGQNLVALASDDGRQAVRLVRERADEFGVRRDRVGMIGFSAGGIVTCEAVFGPAETRPDFAAIIYGARELGEVPKPVPPLFSPPPLTIRWRPADRSSCSIRGARRRAPPSCTFSRSARHGFVNKGGGADHFMDRLEEWLKVNGLLSKAAK